MNGALRPKVTVKVTYNAPSTSSRPPSRTNSPRPPSPMKRTDSTSSPVSATSTFKPRAKINSSAAIRRSPSVVSVTPRSGSPTKLVRAQNGNLSPTFQPRVPASLATAKVTVRPQTPVSAPGTPEGRQRILAQSEVGKNVGPRTRDGSFSLHHAMSFSSLQASSQDRTTSPPTRIRSKVSNLSRTTSENASLPSPYPSTRTAQARVRSPSSSSNISQAANNREMSPPQFYPITTGSPAANPHRFGGRPSPASSSNGQHTYQGLPLGSNDTPPPFMRPKIGGAAKVDLGSTASSPAPPHSPPGSAVSFSSRSSQSSASQINRRESGVIELFSPPLDFSNFGETLDESSISTSGPELNDNEIKVKAAAKTNRKIADLEITNRSLLSINSSLEAAKNKQAKEIRELRRKLRESRLILPPRTYLAVKSSMGPEEDEDDEDDDSELEDVAIGDGDEIYKRVKVMLEGLILSGKKALEAKVEDFAEAGGAKVLTAEEVQSWHRSNKGTTEHDLDSFSELESEADSMSVSADISISSSVNEDEDDDQDDIPFFSRDFYKHAGPPIHVSEAS